MSLLLLLVVLAAPPATGEVKGFVRIGTQSVLVEWGSSQGLSARSVHKGAGYDVMAYNYDIGHCHPARFKQLMPHWKKYLVAKTKADENGDYVLNLPPGTYLIVAMHLEDNLMGWPPMDRSRKRFRRPQLLTVKAHGRYLWLLKGEHIIYPPTKKKTP